MPFEELPHTADWALRVWADDLAGLLAESARGMAALSGLKQASGPRLSRRVKIEAADAESLLVAFLSEIVYLADQDGLGVDGLKVEKLEGSGPFELEVEFVCGAIRSVDKVIKAVTYHNMQIRQTACGLEVEIVFDV